MSGNQTNGNADEDLYQSIILNIFEPTYELNECDELMEMQDVMDIVEQYGLNNRFLVTKILTLNGYKTKVIDGRPIWVMRSK